MTDTDKALDIIVRLMDERQDLREQLDLVHRRAIDTDVLLRQAYDALEAFGVDRGVALSVGIRQLGERIKALESAPDDGRDRFRQYCKEIGETLEAAGYGGLGMVEPVRTLVARVKELENRNADLEAQLRL